MRLFPQQKANILRNQENPSPTLEWEELFFFESKVKQIFHLLENRTPVFSWTTPQKGRKLPPSSKMATLPNKNPCLPRVNTAIPSTVKQKWKLKKNTLYSQSWFKVQESVADRTTNNSERFQKPKPALVFWVIRFYLPTSRCLKHIVYPAAYQHRLCFTSLHVSSTSNYYGSRLMEADPFRYPLYKS